MAPLQCWEVFPSISIGSEAAGDDGPKKMRATLHCGGRSPAVGAYDAGFLYLFLRPDRPARCQVKQLSSRGRHRQSQALVFLVFASRCSGTSGSYPVGLWCRRGTATGDPFNTTDEKPALASAGLTDQVESRRPYPPSSLGVSQRDLDDSRAVCPISRTSLAYIGRRFVVRSLGNCVNWENRISSRSITHATPNLGPED
jgi:hypothetical protein